MRSRLFQPVLCAVLLYPLELAAFCRTTTCDPSIACEDDASACCSLDENGCDRNGIPIAWPTTCVSYSVQEAGSLSDGIGADEFSSALDEAFDAWAGARCIEGKIGLSTSNFGIVACDRVQYRSEAGNANVWMFRASTWSHPRSGGVLDGRSIDANALAVTVISYNYVTGELYDADVEFNTRDFDFSLSEDELKMDLLAVATHEAGHFLGLDHSRVDGATMAAAYERGDLGPRSLSSDDEAAICAAYPPGREAEENECEPRQGYAPECSGCSCETTPSPRAQSSLSGRLPWLFLAVFLLPGARWFGRAGRRGVPS